MTDVMRVQVRRTHKGTISVREHMAPTGSEALEVALDDPRFGPLVAEDRVSEWNLWPGHVIEIEAADFRQQLTAQAPARAAAEAAVDRRHAAEAARLVAQMEAQSADA